MSSAILAVASWPWLFAVNVPLGAIGVALAWPTLPETGRAERRFDWVAAGLNCGGFGLLIFGLGEAAHRAPAGPVLAELAAAAGFFALLLRRQAGQPAPMLPVDLFRRPLFALSSATSVCAFAAQGLAFVSLPFLFESGLGRTAVETGLLMTPWPVVVAVMGPIAGPLSDRTKPALLCGLGLAVLAIGLALLATLPGQPGAFAPGPVAIGWRMAICGAGFGLYQAPNLKAIMSSAPPERSGGASGVVATSRLLGQTCGAALVALCFSVVAAGRLDAARAAAQTLAPRLALALGAGFAAVAGVVSLLRLLAEEPTPERAGPASIRRRRA